MGVASRVNEVEDEGDDEDEQGQWHGKTGNEIVTATGVGTRVKSWMISGTVYAFQRAIGLLG